MPDPETPDRDPETRSRPVPPAPARPVRLSLRRLAPWWPLALLLFVSGYFLAHALWVMPTRVLNAYANSVIESQPVWGALQVARGEPLYDDYRAGRPVVPLTYGVLEYAVPGWAARMTGLESAVGMARTGRLVSLVAGLGIVIVAGLLARRFGAPAPWNWLAAVPLLWFPYPTEWLAKFAPDAPALLCSLGGWLALPRPEQWQRKGHPRTKTARVAAAVVLWTIGFHFKPTVLAGQIAYGVECVWVSSSPSGESRRGRWRAAGAAGLLGGAFLAAVLVTSLLINHATGGLWKLNLIDSMRVCEYKLSFLLGDLGYLRKERPALLVWLAVSAVYFLRATPVAAAFLAIWLFELLLMTKQGSNINYLLGSVVLWGIAACVALGRVMSEKAAGRAKGKQNFKAADTPDSWWRVLYGALGRSTWLLIPIVLLLLKDPGVARIVYWESFPPARDEVLAVDELLRQARSDRILCLEPSYGMAHGLAFPFADSYHASLLAEEGIVDFSPEAERLRRRAYAMVIANRLYRNAFSYHEQLAVPSAIFDALASEYAIAYEGRWLSVWTPRPAGNREGDAPSR